MCIVLNLLLYGILAVFAAIGWWFVESTFIINLRIVQFEDGSFGLRKGIVFAFYRDLTTRSNIWLTRSGGWFDDAKGEEETVTRAYNMLTDRGVEKN